MNIQHIDDGKKGIFTAVEEGEAAGKLFYTWSGEHKFIIEHTEVDPSFNGKGIGKKLVMAAVDMAREKQAKIVPVCPFANALFERIKEIQDVLF